MCHTDPNKMQKAFQKPNISLKTYNHGGGELSCKNILGRKTGWSLVFTERTNDLILLVLEPLTVSSRKIQELINVKVKDKKNRCHPMIIDIDGNI